MPSGELPRSMRGSCAAACASAGDMPSPLPLPPPPGLGLAPRPLGGAEVAGASDTAAVAVHFLGPSGCAGHGKGHHMRVGSKVVASRTTAEGALILGLLVACSETHRQA